MKPSASVDALLMLGARRSTRLRRRFVRQFHRPAGLFGRVIGRVMATRSSNVQRNRWAVDQLAVRPTDRVLEIGFGPGIAIEALVARVTDGAVHGIDHSEVMVRMAVRRNAGALAAGRLRLTRASVADVDEALAPLDLILAVNNLGMWPDPPAQLKDLERLLRPGGRIAIGQQPRTPEADAETARRAGEEVAGLFAEVGLGDIETRQLDLDPPMVLVVGTRTG
jgi:trans-aconitate methyltransferase